jgi:lysophospholipase L1-like esterase
VTYTHDDAWTGPIPAYQGDLLPRTERKRRLHRPLTIVTQGDSITLGNDVSGFLNIPPYTPPWPELFVERLKAVSGDADIRLYNTVLGGTTAEWGLENADSTVAALDPDLVILAFGMNDVWSVPTAQFRANIQGIIHRVRVRRPKTEFILVASICYDPAYAPDTGTRSLMASYVPALQSLTGLGVRVLDMHALSVALFAAKKPKDFLSNPMHPNDFLGRWYAQSLVATLDWASAQTVRAQVKDLLPQRRNLHDAHLRLRARER